MTMTYRFLLKPRWLAFTAVVAAAVILMLNLALWQYQRLGERRDFNRLVTARTELPVQVAEPGWLGPDADPADIEWRTVRVSGIYDGKTDSLAVSGGYQLISPLLLTDGSTVLVNRGAIDVTAPIAPPPQGTVEIIGRIREVPSVLRRDGLTGTYLEAHSSTPTDGGVAAVALPELTDGPHLSYVIQWTIFAICVAVGWVLAVRRSATSHTRGPSRRRNRHQAVPWRDER
jgi:cytochrome oxidase assembly protein ShyY1